MTLTRSLRRAAMCAVLALPLTTACTTIEEYDDSEIKEQIDLIINKIYRNIADRVEEINPTKDEPDWNEIYKHFSAEQIPEVEKLNNPSIMDKIDAADLKAKWPEIRKIIREVLPENDELLALMTTAGCATTPEEINVSPELFAEGMYYHGYMRYRILLTRMMPMIGIDPMQYLD